MHPRCRGYWSKAPTRWAWLVTAVLPGHNAVADRWLAEPEAAVRANGEGLRAMHEALPVRSRPFTWTAGERLAGAQRQAECGWLDPGQWHAVHKSPGIDRALEFAAAVPPADRLVVCHADACAPDARITEDGRWFGQVGLRCPEVHVEHAADLQGRASSDVRW